MKEILLAGSPGTRFSPITKGVNIISQDSSACIKVILIME